MIDLYLHTGTEQAMRDALSRVEVQPSLWLVSLDGEFVGASPWHALNYLGVVVDTPARYAEDWAEIAPATYLPGVYAALRCHDEALADAVRACGVEIVDQPPGVGVWA